MENNNEKPHFDKIVGLPQEYKLRQEQIEELLSQKLKGHGKEKIEKFEIDKTERDIEIVNFVKEAVDEYSKKYTKKKYDVPLQSIHVFNPGGVEEFTEKRFAGGATSIMYGSFIIDRDESDTAFAMCTFHEISHLNSYTALQVREKEKPPLKKYRSGIQIESRNGEKTFFEDIEEAVIEILTRRFYREKIIPSDVFNEEDKKSFPISRAEERAKFEILIITLWEGNKDQFKTREDVEDLFFEAQFTGNLLKMGRLVEKTYGKGSFRRLGEGNLIKTNL